MSSAAASVILGKQLCARACHISHDANGDICEAIVSEVIEIDLMPLQEAYRAAYGVDAGQMFLNLDDYDGRVVYEFGR